MSPIGISRDGAVIVATAAAANPLDCAPIELLEIDRDRAKVYDLTPYVTTLKVNSLEAISLPESGSAAPLGTEDDIQVSGTTIFATQGRFPLISPDGKRLAFIQDENKLMIHSFVDGATQQLLKRKRVGAGALTGDI